MSQNNVTDLDQLWSAVKNNLKHQMTKATYDQLIASSWLISANGVYRVQAASEQARDWLENRLQGSVARALASEINLSTEEIQLEFVTSLVAAQPLEIDGAESSQPGATDPIAAELVNFDLLAAYLDTGGSGYAQLPHLYTYFWMPLLGPAFDLWLSLFADDKRSLKNITPNFWTPARSYTFKELAARLNQQNPRCIYGYADECHRSRQSRLTGKPLATPADCCYNKKWAHLYQPVLSGGGFLCEHWVEGRLETLERLGLARVHLPQPNSRKPRLQIWRLLPPLTPTQVSLLTPQRQQDFEQWLRDYGETIGGLTVERWKAITVPSLLPLLPGYELHTIPVSNLETREARQAFMAIASENPNYLTCMSDIQKDEESLT